MKRIWKFSRPIKLTPSQIPPSQQGNPRQKPLNLNSASLPQNPTQTSRSSDANPSGTTTTVVIPRQRHMQSARNRSTRDLGLSVSRHDPGLKVKSMQPLQSCQTLARARASRGMGQAGWGWTQDSHRPLQPAPRDGKGARQCNVSFTDRPQIPSRTNWNRRCVPPLSPSRPACFAKLGDVPCPSHPRCRSRGRSYRQGYATCVGGFWSVVRVWACWGNRVARCLACLGRCDVVMVGGLLVCVSDRTGGVGARRRV